MIFQTTVRSKRKIGKLEFDCGKNFILEDTESIVYFKKLAFGSDNNDFRWYYIMRWILKYDRTGILYRLKIQ